MQTLVFEEAWDRTISQKDREKMKRIFQEVVENVDTGITFTTVWIALNHKDERLVTAIIHNKTNQVFIFENTRLHFYDEDRILAEHTFTLPALQVPPETSMPWTFIFPAGSFDVPDSTKHTKLQLYK